MRPGRDGAPSDRRIRRSWWIFAGTFVLLGFLLVARLLAEQARPLDWIVAGLVAIVGLAAFRHREAVIALEQGRRAEAESFARILSGLSRSVSEDAIVGAIVEELAGASGADHLVVALRRPDARALQATLISVRRGVPPSTTLLPISDLSDPVETPPRVRTPVAIPVAAEEPVAAVAAVPPPARAASAPSRWSGLRLARQRDPAPARPRPRPPERPAVDRRCDGAGRRRPDRRARARRLRPGQHAGRAAHRPRRDGRRDRALAPLRRAVAGGHPAAPAGRGRRGVVRDVARGLAPRRPSSTPPPTR